jgi:hypothetical protein
MAEDLTDIQSGDGGWQEPDVCQKLEVTSAFKDRFSTRCKSKSVERIRC